LEPALKRLLSFAWELFSFFFFKPCSEDKETARNKFRTVSEGVLVCAAHPLNGTIIAGTKVSSHAN